MESRLSSARRPAESVLTGGRPARRVGSRNSSRSRGSGPHLGSVPLFEFLNDILKFSRALLKQEDNPLREDMFLVGPREGGGGDLTMEQMEDDGTSKWGACCTAINTEMNRLVMWKIDVTQRQLIPALKEQSPLYSVLCESILGIAELLKSRKLYLLTYHPSIIAEKSYHESPS